MGVRLLPWTAPADVKTAKAKTRYVILIFIIPVRSIQQTRYAAAIPGMAQAADKRNLIQYSLV